MAPCLACASELPEGGRFCPTCGTSQGAPSTSAPTETSIPESGQTHSHAAGVVSSDGASAGQVRFLPGTVLGRRYRIVGLLGRGGMGEVYRADDLKLGQAVALKFLPQNFEQNPDRLRRFLNEVRVARQVTHSNVCRVYDVGDFDGQHYLSMEFVDGENLATLLRRIGRLPEDKAVQIARQLCAGLAAAHERGIVHRDLKPANVMIDGQGRVRITDFGLAGLAEGIRGAEVRAGTPAYMAPEQLSGKEVTPRSDLYALGLVLYELFTGKPAYAASSRAELLSQHQSGSLTSPASHVAGLDPAVERVILRCLEQEPASRPADALTVSAALPGGDPLAAALAAGETPSPAMVADAGASEGLNPLVGAACLLVVVVGLIAASWMMGRHKLIAQVRPDKAPQALAAEARALLESIGYTEAPFDRVYGLFSDPAYQQYVERELDAADRWDDLPTIQPAPIHFWYRESPRHLIPQRAVARVTAGNPPLVVSGMTRVTLDARGRLLDLSAVPPQLDTDESVAPEPDWTPLLEAAGLSLETLEPVRPVWNPLVDCDRRAAWEGTYPGQDDVPVRIEAGSYRGRPVFFQTVLPWTKPSRMEQEQQRGPQSTANVVSLVIAGVILLFGILLARRNLRMGRGDRRGALRLGIFTFWSVCLMWVLTSHHTPTMMEALWVIRAVSNALFFAFALGVVYIALEPFGRRMWPGALISWSRLLEGRFRDPRIGRDVLIGGVAAVLVMLISVGYSRVLKPMLDLTPTAPGAGDPESVRNGVMAAASLLNSFWAPIFSGVIWLALILILRIVLRRNWLAAAALTVLVTVISTLGSSDPAVDWAANALVVGLLVFVLTRFGLLALMFFFYFWLTLITLPIVIDFSTWYGGYAALFLAVPIALAGYGFYTSLAGRSLIGDVGTELFS